jgi:2C-methyl-D-erythritol 2,4-cyclodiphosphate synthase
MASSVDRQIFSIIDLLAQLSAEQLQFEEFIDKLIDLLDQLLETDSVLVYISTDNKQKLQLVGSKLKKQARTFKADEIEILQAVAKIIATGFAYRIAS